MRYTLHTRLRRRLALKGLLAAGLGTGLGLGGTRLVGAQGQLLTASGGGVNVKDMPGPDGKPVPLREGFSFDAHYAQCVIEDNPSTFTMDTYAMGQVAIQAHQFYMGMYSNEMSLVSIRRGVRGERIARLVGQLGSATFAGTATVTVGSRTDMEPAFFEIEAVDGGHGGGAGGDRFAFTVFFDPGQAPLNHAIFGPNPTFTGDMVAGEITIGEPVVRPLLD